MNGSLVVGWLVGLIRTWQTNHSTIDLKYDGLVVKHSFPGVSQNFRAPKSSD